jgi:putative ABC transport system permease protein
VAAFLALKSLARGNLRVLALTIAMLMLVYLNLVFTPALLNGAVEGINDKTKNTLSGDIVVEASGDNLVITEAQELVSQIGSADGVASACSRNHVGVEIRHEGERVTTAVYAIDPVQDSSVFQVSNEMVEGSYLDPGDTGQALLGLQIAGADREDLEYYSSSLREVHAGDRVTIYYVTGLQREYTVKGIFYTELIQNDIRAYITEKDFDSIYPLMNDTAASIHVKLDSGAERQSVIEEIGSMRPGLRFQTWEDSLGVLRSTTKTFEQIIVILRSTALIVAAITIFIVTYVDLANKRRQIGIERAIGITSASIAVSYVIRAVLYAIVGIVSAALVFAYVIVPIEARHPFHFPFGDVYLPVSVSYLTTSSLILCAVAMISAFIPAWQTVRAKIIDAIWSV